MGFLRVDSMLHLAGVSPTSHSPVVYDACRSSLWNVSDISFVSQPAGVHDGVPPYVPPMSEPGARLKLKRSPVPSTAPESM